MKILFCGLPSDDMIQPIRPLLKEHECLVCSAEDIREHIEGADILVSLASSVDSELIRQGSFGFVQQFGVGLEKVDIEEATNAGVWVSRAPSTETGNAESVAEEAIMLMLMLARRFPESQTALSEGKLGVPAGLALTGKAACIVGLGGIGRALALRLHGLKMNVTGVHEYPERGKPEGVDTLLGLPDLEKGVSDADFVVLCLNYMPDRYHFFDQTQLAAMKEGSFLINIARGGLLNEEALLEALGSGHLAGAGLDVFWEEPVDPHHPLFRQNVIATPHIAGVTDINFEGTARLVVANIQRYARGDKPWYTANAPEHIRSNTTR